MVRRIVTAVIAFSALMFLYALYLAAFRRYWALQELPTEFLPPSTAPHTAGLIDGREDVATEVAREVFGPDAWQTNAVISLFWAEQGVFLYANEYAFPTERTMKLAPVSVVRKRPVVGGDVEYLVLQADEAQLEFDRAISVTNFSAARPVRARAAGNVHVAWNRGTADASDDVDAYLADLIFDGKRKLLWTTGAVRVTGDNIALTGEGGRITFLDGDVNRLKVESVQINRAVRVEGMLSRQTRQLLAPTADSGGSRGNDRSRYFALSCSGPLVLDAQALQAIFHKNVVVRLQDGATAADTVQADELRLSFATQEGEPSSAPASTSAAGRMSLKVAEAVGQPVVVQSPSRRLTARATRMVYDAPTKLLSLDGSTGVEAAYGSVGIRVARLQVRVGPAGNLEGVAPGPGELAGKADDDAAAGPRLTASWREEARLELIEGKHVVTLSGDVHVQQPGKGELVAQRTVRLWFDKKGFDTEANSSTLPRRIEATGAVVLSSSESVLRTELLVAEFLVPATTAPDEAAQQALEDAGSAHLSPAADVIFCQYQDEGPAVRIRSVMPIEGAPEQREVQETKGANEGDTGDEPVHETREPESTVEVNAGRIRAIVEVAPEKLIPREVWAEETVSIIQKPRTGEGAGLEINGDTVHARHVDNGYFFEVTGAPALVSGDGLVLQGKLIGLDQPTQVAWVRGEGRAVFRTELPLAPGGTEGDQVEVTWSNDMFFDGLVAEFTGGVRVAQGETIVMCERLEAHLSERIALAEKSRDTVHPSLARLVATGAVQLRRDTPEGVTKIEGLRMVYTASDKHLVIAGPGKFWLTSFGSSAFGPGVNQSASTPRWTGTLILFDRLMEIDQNTGVVQFVGRVRVWNAPLDDRNHEFSHAAPPSDAIFVSCDQLDLLLAGPGDVTAIGTAGTVRQLLARGNARIQGRGFYAYADVLKYDAGGDQPRVIAEASGTGFATFYRQTAPGRRPDVLRARKITYWPQTGEFRQEGGIMLDVRETGTGSATGARR